MIEEKGPMNAPEGLNAPDPAAENSAGLQAQIEQVAAPDQIALLSTAVEKLTRIVEELHSRHNGISMLILSLYERLGINPPRV